MIFTRQVEQKEIRRENNTIDENPVKTNQLHIKFKTYLKKRAF